MLSAADSRITISTATQQIVRYDTPTAQYQHYSNTKKIADMRFLCHIPAITL